MGYAYLDKYGILHISEFDGEGRTETGFKFKGGFPVIRNKQVYMYGLDEAYIGGNRNSYEAIPPTAKKLDLAEETGLVELYKECMRVKA